MKEIKERFVDWTYDEFCVRAIDGEWLYGSDDYKKVLSWLKKDCDACYVEGENLDDDNNCLHSDVLAYAYIKYDYKKIKKQWEGLFDVETPQSVADFNNQIINADGILYYPNDACLWWVDSFK